MRRKKQYEINAKYGERVKKKRVNGDPSKGEPKLTGMNNGQSTPLPPTPLAKPGFSPFPLDT